MKLYEYQARELFTKYGIDSAPAMVASNPEEALEAAAKLGGACAVKAQVLAGGRGKAGGVKMAQNPEEAREHADSILGMTIKSLPVEKVLVSQAVDIDREYYIGLTVDRTAKAITLIVSSAGGVDIEDLARSEPEKVHHLTINPLKGVSEEEARSLLAEVFDKPDLLMQAMDTAKSLFKLFMENDCSLVEINPFALTKTGELIALDAKVVIDENGMFKHEALEAMRNREEYGPDELEARGWGLSFINMEGNIGCIVNGAGLAMATMDVVKLAGGMPANFLDVGGGATVEMVKNGLRILVSDRNVKAILINIFGGILRCDTLAKGVIEAASEITIKVPVVIRMEGTNVEAGRKLLQESGLKLIVADTMKEAAEKVIASIKS